MAGIWQYRCNLDGQLDVQEKDRDGKWMKRDETVSMKTLHMGRGRYCAQGKIESPPLYRGPVLLG